MSGYSLPRANIGTCSNSKPFLTLDLSANETPEQLSDVAAVLGHCARSTFSKQGLVDAAKVRAAAERAQAEAAWQSAADGVPLDTDAATAVVPATEAEAALRAVVASARKWLWDELRQPSPELVKLALRNLEFDGRVTRKYVDKLTPAVREGLMQAVAHDILGRIDPNNPAAAALTGVQQKEPVTTPGELDFYHYCRLRLAYHSEGRYPFEAIQDVAFDDSDVERFRVYYRQKRKGLLIELDEQDDRVCHFYVPGNEKPIIATGFEAIDAPLIRIMIQRVGEIGE